MGTNKILGAFIFLCTLLSCNSGQEQVSMQSLNGIWNKKKPVNFEFENSRPNETKNIIFVVRNNNEYPYRNLRLFVDFSDPASGIKNRDTLNYVLAKPNGEWLGKGFGETKEILFQYRMNYHFREKGKYKISVIQAMRRDNLPGIEDFGVKIETAKQHEK